MEQRLLERGLQTRQQLIAAQQKVVELQAGVDKNRAQLVAIEAQRFGLQSLPETSRRDAAMRVEELGATGAGAGSAEDVEYAGDFAVCGGGGGVEGI